MSERFTAGRRPVTTDPTAPPPQTRDLPRLDTREATAAYLASGRVSAQEAHGLVWRQQDIIAEQDAEIARLRAQRDRLEATVARQQATIDRLRAGIAECCDLLHDEGGHAPELQAAWERLARLQGEG